MNNKPMNFEEFTTKRIILRKFTQESYDKIFSKMNEDEQLKILGLDSTEELLKEKEKYENGLTSHNKKLLYFQLIDKRTSKIIGWCGYHTWYIDHNRAEIGYGLFDENYKNKGIMTEAIESVIIYGFDSMKLERIEAFVSPNNTPSLKLLKKMKFQKEGLLKQHYFNNNKMEDSMVFGLLRSEY